MPDTPPPSSGRRTGRRDRNLDLRRVRGDQLAALRFARNYPGIRVAGRVSRYIVVFCAAMRRSSSLTMLYLANMLRVR
jgi:hypothetical protein